MKHTFTSPNGEEYEVEGPDGSSREQAFNVLQEGIKAGYYKPKKKSVGAIPGQEGEEARVAALKAQPGSSIGDKLLGAGEAVLATATGLFSGIQAPIAGLAKSAFGMVPDAEKETARLMQEQTYAPRTEVGKDYAENVGKVINDVLAPLGPGNLTGLAQARPMPGLLRKDKPITQPPVVDRSAILKETTTPVATPEVLPRFEQMVTDLGGEIKPKETPFSGMVDTLQGRARVIEPEFKMAPEEKPYVKTKAEAAADDALVARLEASVNKQNPAREPMAVTPEGQGIAPNDIGTLTALKQHLESQQNAYLEAQARGGRVMSSIVNDLELMQLQQKLKRVQDVLDARQAALELEVKQKATRDFNAAERGRQEAAPTGFEQWRDDQRMAAEQRRPGDNSPLDFTKEDAPYSLTAGPTPVKGLDYTQHRAEMLSRGITKLEDINAAWKQRQKQQLEESTRQRGKDEASLKLEPILNDLEQTLREQAYKPTGDGQGPKTRNFNRFGQGGSAPIIGDLAEGIVRLGRGLKAKFTGEVPPKPDTIATPRSAATIKAKQEKAAKAEAIGLKDSVYSAPTTIEEVLANPGKDLTTSLQDLTPGMYAMVRKNAANNVLKFVNRTFTEARLNKIKDSVELITGRNAYNDLLRKLTPEEKVLVAQDALTLDKEGKLWTDAKAEQLGYTPAMKAFMDWRMKAHKTVADKADAVLAEQGLKALNRRNSYAPSNYDTAYTALVGKIGVDANGKKTFKVVVPLNANSHWELKKALAWAKEKYSGPEYQIQELPRKGLNTQSTKGYKGVAKEGIARLLEEMAKLDPNMQAAKAELDSWIEGQTQKLYGHDVHLLRKQGLEGSIGDRPWLDARRNAEDFFAQEVNHIEEALQYWNYQKPINETRKLAAEPSIGHMKNTVKVMDKYLQHVTGQGLNPIGAALNTVVDAVFAAFGKGSGKTINNVTNTTREVATIWMMGVYNPTFMNVQLSQTLTGMVPEVARLRSEFGLGPETVATSFGNSTFGLTMMGAADAIGKLDSVSVAPHLVEAYKWMKEHGLTRYNEVEQSHAATQNPKWHTTKQVLSLPITIPEKITTPQAFMWAVDMMHQAGKTGDDLYLSAYNAAKYAMTEYHPDEAPMVYQRLGVVGQHIGGLKKFVHNAVDQQASRSLELAKHPAAFASMMGMTLLTMGAMGLAGVGTLDKLSVSLTDKGLRDHYDEMFGTSKTSQGVRDGFLSVLTGYDLQTRYSMADLIPNSFGEAVAGPHISKLAKMGMSLIDYGMNPSEHSFREMSKQMVPSGLAGTLEEKYLLGKQGQVLDKEGQNKFPGDMKRTPAEHTVRAFGGPRPIRERLYDEQKYQADVVQRKKDKDRVAAAKEMVVAVGFGDDKGFKAAMQKFIDSEGDISTLDQRIQTYMEDKGMSAKQRAAGTPGESPSSIGRFRRYQER